MDLTEESHALQDNTEGNETAGAILAIDKSSVHRICSGQVVLTLATAVKELVENSLDAGATCVDIRLKDSGCERIEVIDNGSGVAPSNFKGLTLKHYTSKLSDFADLSMVETFGFRGEALSSLCALSKLFMTTCHQSQSVGSRLEFDAGGILTSVTACARQCGTTVYVDSLFHSLPVRHNEFKRNINREFLKLVHCLSAFCIIQTGVKITLSNQPAGSNKRTTVLTVRGGTSMKDNISDLYGLKQLQDLLEWKTCSPSAELLTDYGLSSLSHEQIKNNPFSLSGYISSTVHGRGRSTTDRQFFYINHRPCDPNKIVRLVNEVYRQFNRHQSPFVVLDVSVSRHAVDVNVTPDKRQIFIDNEKLLLATIKTSLLKMFESTQSLCPSNTLHSSTRVISSGRTTEDVSNDKVKEHRPSIDNQSQSSLRVGQQPEQDSHSAHDDNSSLLTRDSRNGSVGLSSLKRRFSSAFASSSPVKMTSPMQKRAMVQSKLSTYSSEPLTKSSLSDCSHFH